MASTPGPSLAHRSVANIRTGAGAGSPSGSGTPGGASGAGGAGGGPVSPHTPLRAGMSPAFASPSSMRAEEDTIVVELGSRRLRVGFAGDPSPKAIIEFGPDQARRLGDFRHWDPKNQQQQALTPWSDDHELWRLDMRGLDLGLVADKLERGLREAFSTHLLIDSRPRKVVLALPPMMPVPLLSATLDTIFGRFLAPIISLLSSPVSTAFAAGVRSALVVDMGWHEAVVTTVYEYREVACTRSVRAGKTLVHETHRLLARAVAAQDGSRDSADDSDGSNTKPVVSFAECEDVVARVVWCKPAADKGTHGGGGTKEESSPDGLTTVAEQDESDAEMPPPPPAPADSPTDPSRDKISIPLTSASPPTTVTLPFEQLAEPCERAFFETQCSRASFDDEELPLHLLVYEHLAALPMDVRSMCMSRIIFTGGCAGVLGLRGRVFDEVDRLARRWGWDVVRGKMVDKRRAEGSPRARPKATNSGGSGSGPAEADGGDAGNGDAKPSGGQEEDGVWHDAANAVPAPDPIEAHMRRQQQQQQSAKTGAAARKLPEPLEAGGLRVIESLGPWAGASLLSQLRAPAIATIDRELWLQQGAAGASRASEVDLKTQHRQSTRPGEFISRATAGGATNTNWTLGVWGTLQ
ncbi:hypothetical protein RB595_005107 [Gaeumannomyces hyphopodioides]